MKFASEFMNIHGGKEVRGRRPEVGVRD